MHKTNSIVKEQANLILKSGLYDECEKIFINLAADKTTQLRKLPEKFEVVNRSKLEEFEFPALQMIKKYTNTEDKILYIHTKGASKTGNQRTGADKWREFMNWANIERYKEHLEKLTDFDISGAQLVKLNRRFRKLCGVPAVFAGNFFWSSGSYIDLLDTPEILKNRWEAEGWIFKKNPNFYDICNLTNKKMITSRNCFNDPKFSRADYDPNFSPYYKNKNVPKMVESRTEIINSLIEKYNYKSYLEIGLFNMLNFNSVKCEEKVGVDPAVSKATYKMTSDDFFKQNNKKFDLIFIDGLHEHKQVLRDIENALNVLNENGTIVCHDMYPETEYEARHVSEYHGDGSIWSGDCYKAWIDLRMSREDLKMYVIDCDFGTSIIRKGSQELYKTNADVYSFRYYKQNREKMMNVIEPENYYDFLEEL